MSHFTVLVIGDNVAEQLAPFHEFECTGTNDKYVQEIDETESERADYEKATRKRYRDSQGTLHDPYDDRFYREFTPEEKAKHGTRFMGTGGGDGISWHSKDWGDGRGYRAKVHFMPEGWEEVDVPVKDFMSFRDFIDYNYSRKTILEGETPDIEGDHKYGYTVVDKDGNVVKTVDRTNPNRKWDWYQMGGRWNGFFKLKKDGVGVRGEASLISKMDPDYKAPGRDRADATLKGEIDIEGMREEARQKAASEWDLVHSVVKDLPLWLSWDQTREKFGEGKIKEARDFYWAQAGPEALRQNKETVWFEADEFLVNRDAYIERAASRAFRTFAVVKDSQWFEKGGMGWWGCVHNEKDEDLWNDEFSKLLDSVPDDTLLSVVDCHI
jgi:hypothetical protein